MQNDVAIPKVEVWAMNAPAVKSDPDLMFALCSVEPSSTATKLLLKQKVPPSDEVCLQNSWSTYVTSSVASSAFRVLLEPLRTPKIP